MRRVAGLVLLLGALLLVASGFINASAPKARADTSHTPLAWCALNVSNLTPGASFNWFVSCQASAGNSISSAGTFRPRIDLLLNASDDSTYCSGGIALPSGAFTVPVSGQTFQMSSSGTWTNPIVSPGVDSSCGSSNAFLNLRPARCHSNNNADSNCQVGGNWVTNGTQYFQMGAGGAGIGPNVGGSPACNQQATACTQSNEAMWDNGAMKIGNTYPAYPPIGGTAAGPALGTLTCGVDTSAGGGVFKAAFQSTLSNAGSYTSVTYAWVFGDGQSGSGTAPTHFYSGVNNAGASWVASETVTGSGAWGSVSGTVTFDFSSPGHVDCTGGTQAPGPGPPAPSTNPPTSCDWFDLPCWLKWLFIPSGTALSDGYDTLSTAAQSHWPIGPLVDVKNRLSTANTEAAGATQNNVNLTQSADPNCSGAFLPLNLSTPQHTFATQLVPVLPTYCTDNPGSLQALPGLPPTTATDSTVHLLHDLAWWGSTLFAVITGLFVVRSAAMKITSNGGGP